MQICADTTETQELFGPQCLYLKPIAKLTISVQLPQLKIPGKSISNWEVMEKIKAGVKPNKFLVLKVSKSTLEFIRFEGEAENRSGMKNIISRLDNRTIKLSGFPDLLRVRAAEAKTTFPTRHDWDSYFRDVKNMNEMKPGERPDTIHFQLLPCRWFANKKEADQDVPSEYILKKVFETFGEIRCVDIPMLDPYRRDAQREPGTIQTFSFGQDLTFEAYVQYQEYIGFVKAMAAFRGMKLMHKGEDGNCFTTNIKVDFDRTKHLCEKNIRKRCLEREKLIQIEKDKEERLRLEKEIEGKRKEEENKRKEDDDKERELKREEKLLKREERRKERLIEKKKLAEQKDLAIQRSLEEEMKMKADRKAGAKRLLSVLFDKAKVVKQKEEIRRRMSVLERERKQKLAEEERIRKEAEEEKRRQVELERQKEKQKAQLLRQEQVLREKILLNIQRKQEEQRREQLRQELSGRTKLKSVLVTQTTSKDSFKESTSVPKLKSVLVINQ